MQLGAIDNAQCAVNRLRFSLVKFYIGILKRSVNTCTQMCAMYVLHTLTFARLLSDISAGNCLNTVHSPLCINLCAAER
jgi:hypothetical protein